MSYRLRTNERATIKKLRQSLPCSLQHFLGCILVVFSFHRVQPMGGPSYTGYCKPRKAECNNVIQLRMRWSWHIYKREGCLLPTTKAPHITFYTMRYRIGPHQPRQCAAHSAPPPKPSFRTQPSAPDTARAFLILA